jgi:beta-lactamase regulating signal transducer with metallopeptidase domain
MNYWVIENLGYVLIHSLWQIGFVALIFFLALRILQNASANLRYLVSILALCLALILPVATFIYFSKNTKTINAVKEKLSSITKSEPIIQNFETRAIPPNSQIPAINSTKTNDLTPSLNFPWLPSLVILWLFGVLGFSIRLLGGIWTVHNYRTRNILPVSPDWQNTFEELCKNLQIKQKINFLQSTAVEMPVVIGWLKPVILIPVSAFLQISSKELETILLHELTHIKRNDYLVNFIQSLVEILFFYHPCVWWISSKIRSEREFAVDEFVSQIFETERLIYANALANLEEIRLASNQLTPTLAMAGTGGNLMKRIENILQGNRKLNSKNISIWSAVFAITFVIGISAGFYWLKTSEIKKSKSGRKIAVVFSNSLAMYSDYLAKELGNQSYQKLLELQTKYQMPATWTLDAMLIEELRKNGKADDFFSQAHENNSNFMLYVPNISYTVFINGDDEYIATWKKRVQFVEENLAKNGNKLDYYLRPAQIPKEMEDFLVKRGLPLGSSPNLDYSVIYSHAYDKECDRKMMSCQETTIEKRQEIRQKFINYINESFELNQKFAREKSGTEVPQILTLNVDNLTTDSADELLQTLKDSGYEFVPLEEAQSNEMNKLRAELTKSREFILQKFEIQKKYQIERLGVTKEELEAAQKKILENSKKNNFKVEINTKDFKIKVKEQ